MAYLLYKKCGEEYVQLRESSLAGNKNGIVSRYLRPIATAETSEPWQWHLPMRAALAELEGDADAFVIDLKSRNPGVVSLYEVRDIWGFTMAEWTPVMLNLYPLLVDEEPAAFNKKRFCPPHQDRQEVVTFLYLAGGVNGGQLKGTWNFPGPSATNSVLLWPDALDYFMRQRGGMNRHAG